jgi:hypothetical protein
MRESTRRRFLQMGGVTGVVGVAGCLRLTGTDDSSTATTQAPEDSPSTATATATATQSGGDGTFGAQRFYMNSFDSDGSVYDNQEFARLDVETSDGQVGLTGEWSGDRRTLATQACKRCSFEVLEDGSVVASTGEEILIFGYQYALAQSDDAAFITYQPSVREDWDRTLRLSYPSGEYTVTPEIRPDDGVFEFDFSAADVDAGRYEWILEITPPNGFTIEIGTFNEGLISVSPSDGSFPDSEEAIRSASAAANATPTPVEPPQTQQGDGMEIRESGHSGGGPGDIAGQYISRDVSVNCLLDIPFGSGSGRAFRVNNLTNQISVTFTPE